MLPAPDPPRWGCTAKAIVILICLAFIVGFITSAWSTQNPLFILGAIGGACIALLQIKFIHNWFIYSAGPFIDQHAGKMIKGLKQGAVKTWELRNILLLFIIFGLVIGGFTPVPGMAHNQIYNSVCIQNQTPLFFCGNGIYVTPLQVDENKNNQHIKSDMNIGIIDNKDKGPFNQYDANNNGAEQELEKWIFAENQNCSHPSYVTLIVATPLSQTVADTGLSSNAGLDNLRGAYMAQYNFNRVQTNFCLHLLIANFGTKKVVSQTILILMEQIKLYAYSDQQHFMGVVGFPFSASVIRALYSRYSISGDDIPIISASATADSFADPNSTDRPPNNFYTNFYRIAPPDSLASQVIRDFMEKYSGNDLAPAQTQTVLFEDPSDQYSKSLGDAIFKNFNGSIQQENYKIGQPETLNEGIGYIKDHQCNQNQQPSCKPIQIFFSGYADDLNTLKTKLKAAYDKNVIKQSPIHIIGGDGFYDLGSYNIGNYANLFFTMNASYARINRQFPSDEIPQKYHNCPGQKPPYSEPFNCEFSNFFNRVYPTNIYGSELAGTQVLLTYDAVQAFLHALTQVEEATTTTPLRQAINKHWSDVKFQGVSGKIQFSLNNGSVNNPINKPVYVACTDNQGHTHVVAEYDMNDNQLPANPFIDSVELKACLP